MNNLTSTLFMPNQVEPPEPTPEEIEDAALREVLGKIVRAEWIAWAKEQPCPKPSWLVEWDSLGEPDKEVDRRIGERLFREGLRSTLLRPTPRTAQEHFVDKDVFANYVADKVNPARLKEGLSCISNSHANVCYDVLTSGRYLK